MNNLKIVIAGAAIWSVLASLIWTHTSYSGIGADSWIRDIETLSRVESPHLAEVCRIDLIEFARERLRSLIAGSYPSAIRFSGNAETIGKRYLTSHCAVGPFLAVASLTSEAANSIRRANGYTATYATPD